MRLEAHRPRRAKGSPADMSACLGICGSRMQPSGAFQPCCYGTRRNCCMLFSIGSGAFFVPVSFCLASFHYPIFFACAVGILGKVQPTHKSHLPCRQLPSSLFDFLFPTTKPPSHYFAESAALVLRQHWSKISLNNSPDQYSGTNLRTDIAASPGNR